MRQLGDLARRSAPPGEPASAQRPSGARCASTTRCHTVSVQLPAPSFARPGPASRPGPRRAL